MGAEIKSGQVGVRHPEVSFEAGDMSHGSVFAFLLTLACGLLIVHIAVWSIFHYLGEPQVADHQTTNPIMTSNEQLQEIGGDPALAYPKPTLQPNPVADLNKFRAAEEEQLTTYGWVDPSARKIRIPIERAIDTLSASWPNQQANQEQQASKPNSPTRDHASPPLKKPYQGKGQ